MTGTAPHGPHGQRQDRVSARLIAQMRATLAGHLAPGAVPPGLFWALAPEALAPGGLGRDGHPRPGAAPDSLVPDLPLPRRMWAGGQIALPGDLAPGDLVTKDSSLLSVTPKRGASGDLIFVSLRHLYRVDGQLRIDERQDLVFRADPSPDHTPSGPAPPAPDLGAALLQRPLVTDPVLLFRFSALTFNGHRIHYDADYARQVEGYGGLVVHGPLQAMVMLNMAAELFGRTPARFAYRAQQPLIAGTDAVVEAHQAGGPGRLDLRVRALGGPVTMSAAATV